MSEQSGSGTSTYSRVWANREARGLLIGQALSELGDQAARVAIALLVLAQTGSALYSALVLALDLPPRLPRSGRALQPRGPAPRRTLMIVCDLIRAALMAALVLLASGTGRCCPSSVLLLVAEFVSMPFGRPAGRSTRTC